MFLCNIDNLSKRPAHLGGILHIWQALNIVDKDMYCEWAQKVHAERNWTLRVVVIGTLRLRMKSFLLSLMTVVDECEDCELIESIEKTSIYSRVP